MTPSEGTNREFKYLRHYNGEFGTLHRVAPSLFLSVIGHRLRDKILGYNLKSRGSLPCDARSRMRLWRESADRFRGS